MTWNSTRSQNYSVESFKTYNALPRPVCIAKVCSRNVTHEGKRNTGRKKCKDCSFVRRLS